MNQTCPKERILVDISDCIFCKSFDENKSNFCGFKNEGSCDYYLENEIIKLLLKNRR
jgi:hypothetical protein